MNLAFLGTWGNYVLSLGVLIILYVCKRLVTHLKKRRIIQMVPNELVNNNDVNTELSQVTKELVDLEMICAKYGYRVVFQVQIVPFDDEGQLKVEGGDE